MLLPKNLYVDLMNLETGMAMTADNVSLRHNLVVLEKFKENKSPVFAVGIYVCVFLIKKNSPILFFYNLKSHPENINTILNSDEFDQEFKQTFVSVAESVNANYESNINVVELVIGKVPEDVAAELE